LKSRLWQAGLLALGLIVACGGSVSRHEPDASPQSSTGGGMAEAGAAPAVTSGGKATSSGGASESGGTRTSGGIAEAAGGGSRGVSTSVSGGVGGAGLGGGGGMGAAVSGSGGAGPVHDRCADPFQLEFVNGEATVSDDTTRATDEFPTLTCAPYPEPGFQGGQIYYRFTARPGREYALRLNPRSFSTLVFYVFPAGGPSAVEAIRAACSSDGVTGTRPTNTRSTGLTPFAPREPGDYIVGVDTSLTKGSPFTLSVFEYCGTSGGTDCKVKGCDLNLWQTCLGNTLSACNDDGTATVNTDCAMTGKACDARGCVASVSDNVGNAGWTTSPAMNAGVAGVTLLDFYEVTTSRTITQLEIIMVQPRVFTLDWRILESTDRAGPYQSIFTKRTMSAGGMMTSSETTGPIQVPILAGRFYAIGVALPADARYYLQQQAEKSLPQDVSFGRLTSAAVVQSASSSTTTGYPVPGNISIAQWITTKL
jgi:hypothetical protein